MQMTVEDGTPGEGFDGGSGDRLQGSLIALSRLCTGRVPLEDVLTQVATFAVAAIPHAVGAGLTLLEPNRADTIVATAPFVTEVDAIQYSLGDGPCISATAQGQTMMSGSLGGDLRWRQFGSKVARLGVHSVVSLPLITPTGVIGAMNVYAHAKNAFDERAAELGELFATPAAVAVQNAQILDQTQRLVQQLQVAMTERGIIDQSLGIIMSRSGVSADEAMARLRRMSQTEHVKLARIAQSVVDEAQRRARARHPE